MLRRLRPRQAVVSAVVLAFSRIAGAQPVAPQSLGAAQAIFDDGQRLMAARNYAEACPKFEEVVRLVPSGVGAKMQLAKCYDEAGRLASAWAAYVVAENAASTAGQADRVKIAKERASALKPRLSTLAITVPAGLRAVEGLEVKRDEASVRQPEWGIAVPVDSGVHKITVTAPKKKPWQASVEVKGEASATSIPLPDKLDDAPETPAAPPPAAALSDAPAVTVRSGVPTWAWVVGGVGTALAGASIGFLIDERAAQSNIDTHCPGGKTCDKGFDAHGANTRLYRDFGLFVGLGIGGVLGLGASIVGIATAPGKPKAALPHPWIGPGTAALAWEGQF